MGTAQERAGRLRGRPGRDLRLHGTRAGIGGTTFIEPGLQVYAGMVVGLYTRQGASDCQRLQAEAGHERAGLELREIDERLVFPATIFSAWSSH